MSYAEVGTGWERDHLGDPRDDAGAHDVLGLGAKPATDPPEPERDDPPPEGWNHREGWGPWWAER